MVDALAHPQEREPRPSLADPSACLIFISVIAIAVVVEFFQVHLADGCLCTAEYVHLRAPSFVLPQT